ncbi:follistatin-related protein 5 [Dendroctonus ponderosae]|uniref:follistatin-related protein 5 n=1 Tax=Dendroctonus ponderosae TaxID=77166 RepID=UPI002035F156|nr:follistatin-related protein 5 [Dendroctonus ponderosae]
MPRHKPALILFCLGLLVLGAFPSRQSALPENKSLRSQRHHRDVFSTDEPETTVRPLLENDPCLSHYCPSGRDCKLRANTPVCECSKKCIPHHSICASDGMVYPSHCHMHSTACTVRKRLIQMDASFCQKREKTERDWISEKIPESKPFEDHKSRNDSSRISATGLSNVQSVLVLPSLKSGDLSNLLNEIEDHYYGRDECSMQEYEVMKDNLLLYNHAKLMSENQSKDYLLSMMFSHYDKNNDEHLEKFELDQVSAEDQDLVNVINLTSGCSLASMIEFDDTDKDAKLSINEFSVAMSKLYSVSVVSLDKALEVNQVSARLGDNVELHCAVTGSPIPPVLWRRHGQDLAILDQEDVKVYGDGSLYLTKVQLQHAGNYTCSAQRNPHVVQTHILTVHTLPEVNVMPKIQSKKPGEDAQMFCHVSGEPFPQVKWLKNDEELKIDENSKKYQIIGNGTSLKIRKIDFADTGAYMCEATNVGGLTRDISSLVVQDQPTPQSSVDEEHRFFAFHDWGICVYEPTTCRLHHMIEGTDIIPGTQEYVCGGRGTSCSWGRAVAISNRYIYASQPTLDRILIVSTVQMAVVDVVGTDKVPVELGKVLHLDQLWLLSWREGNDTGIKTVQVIRDAGQKRKHHTVHPEPIDGQFDMVKELFLPSSFQEISHYTYKYGYVTHSNQRGLYKLDLENLRYTRSVDLTPYNCVPEEIQFSALYGFVFMECKEPVTRKPTGQLVLDYLTDAVISTSATLFGRPYISPDSRKLVTFDRTPTGSTLIVQEIKGHGLEFLFDVKTTLNISDITFYPSQTTHSYDLYASGQNKEDLLFVNLNTGKVEIITGVGIASTTSTWNNPARPITTAGRFGAFLASPSNHALFIINGQSRTVNCEISAVAKPSQIVWITQIYH